MSKDTIECPDCKGTGRRPLSAPYAATMQLFRNGSQRTAVETAEALEIDKTACMMRLARLVQWRLLDHAAQAGKLGRLYFKRSK